MLSQVTHASSPEANSETSYRGINSLPPEILSYIFIIGSDCRRYDDFIDFGDDMNGYDNHDDDDDGDPREHFATLCSGVCQFWRNVAIDTCQLWSNLTFDGSLVSLERSRIWIDRSKDAPLAISVDLSSEESRGGEESTSRDEYIVGSHRILDMIMPKVHLWKMFALETNSYDLICLWQWRLALRPSAPILESIAFICYTEWTTEDTFHPPELRSPKIFFPLGTPNIRSVVLWGVHVDWQLISFSPGLRKLQLAWHTKDVRPTTEQFVQILNRSPKLETLSLEGSAPLPGTWPLERIQLPNLRRLGLVQISLSDALSVTDHIDFPALVTLKLDLEEDDVAMFIRSFCQSDRPRLGSLQSLRVSSFQCSRRDGKLFFGTLLNVRSMILNFHFLPLHFYDSLTSYSPLLCPRLERLKLSGVTARQVKALVKARKKSSTPIRRLYLDRDDGISPGIIEWLRREVETVLFFYNSDVEDDDDSYDSDDWTDASQEGDSQEMD